MNDEKKDRQWLINSIIELETADLTESRKEQAQHQIKSNIERFIAIVEEQASKTLRTLVDKNPSAKKIKSEELKGLQKQILSTGLKKQEAYVVLGVLSNWVTVGNEAEFWDLCPPPLPVFLKAPVSPFGKESRINTLAVDQLRQVLSESTKFQTEMEEKGSEQELLGQFLLSAIINGDIHNQLSLNAILSQISEPMTYCDGLAWLDLRLEESSQTTFELRRWFPDKFTELLFYRLTPREFKLANSLSSSANRTIVIFRCIKHFLSKMGLKTEERPSGIGVLFKMAAYQRMLNSSAIIASYTTRKFHSHSLKEHVWHRLFHAEANEPSDISTMRKISSGDEVSAIAESPSAIFWVLDFRKFVFGQSENLASSASQCETYLSGTPKSCTVRYLIPEWVLYLLTQRQKSRGKFSVGSIKGYLSSVGKRIANAASDIDLTTLDSAGYEDLYWTILEDAESTSLKQKIRKGLREFHDFLIWKYQVPEMNDHVLLGSDRTGLPVDANLLSLEEYNRCFSVLEIDRELNTFDPDLGRIAQLIFLIGFRCGTRRSEVLKLRLADYHPSSRPELLIRPWSNRTLKTKSSTRKLPLYTLLEERELGLLQQWYNKRLEDEQNSEGSLSEAYLFALRKQKMLSIPEEFVFRKIHRVMRAVIGDETIRYHHLRHSFASWTMMRLMLSDLKTTPCLFKSNLETQKWLESSKKFRKNLYHDEGVSRKHAYAVASLLGHSSPEISLQHYIHVLDLITRVGQSVPENTRDLIRLAKISSGKLYQHKTHKNSENFISLVREHALKDRSKILVQHQINSDYVEGGSQQDELPGSEVLTNLYTFLTFTARDPGQDINTLGQQFGFNREESQRYFKNAKYVANLQSAHSGNARFKLLLPENEAGEKALALVPIWRMGESDQKDFYQAADRIYRLLKTQQKEIEHVCHYYVHNVWSSRSGLIFDLSQIKIANCYLNFFKILGFDKQRVQLCFYQGVGKKVSTRWRNQLDLSAFHEGGKLSPSNRYSQAAQEYINIKLLMNDPGCLPANSETQFLSLLNFLLVVEISKPEITRPSGND